MENLKINGSKMYTVVSFLPGIGCEPVSLFQKLHPASIRPTKHALQCMLGRPPMQLCIHQRYSQNAASVRDSHFFFPFLFSKLPTVYLLKEMQSILRFMLQSESCIARRDSLLSRRHADAHKSRLTFCQSQRVRIAPASKLLAGGRRGKKKNEKKNQAHLLERSDATQGTRGGVAPATKEPGVSAIDHQRYSGGSALCLRPRGVRAGGDAGKAVYLRFSTINNRGPCFSQLFVICPCLTACKPIRSNAAQNLIKKRQIQTL